MRRTTFRLLFISLLALAAVAGGCSAQAVTTTSLDQGGPGATTPLVPGGTVGGGVVLSVAADAIVELDPAAATSTGDILVLHQIYDWLVEEDGGGGLRPGLAESWERSSPTAWTFTLRPNVIFQDGDPFEAEDVVHTFERLRLLADSTGLHSSLADYAVIESVIAIDEGTVRFVLGRPDSDFLALLARDAAAILSDGTRDPSTEWVGTGPFVLWSYRAGEGAVLRRNPAYWARDAGGRQLPYVDGLNVVFKSDPETRLAELVAGRVQFVGGLDLADIRLVDATPGLTTLRTPSNEHLSIYIESGPGRVGEDVRVRRALKLGTDRAALAEAVRPSLSTPGNDSPVGPFYGERHLDEVPEYNPEAAGLLLTEAGIVDGLKLVLDVPDDPEAAALAQAWAAQMEMIGVTVEIRDATSGAGGGVDGATADARIARSISAPSPFDSLVHAYAVGVDSAAGIWVDADFEALVAQLAAETDEILQVDLYHQIQQVLIERGPAVVPFYETVVAGAGKTLLGVSVAPYWPRTSFRTASFGS